MREGSQEGKGRPLAFGNPECELVKRRGGNTDGMHSQANDHIELYLLLWEKSRQHSLNWRCSFEVSIERQASFKGHCSLVHTSMWEHVLPDYYWAFDVQQLNPYTNWKEYLERTTLSRYYIWPHIQGGTQIHMILLFMSNHCFVLNRQATCLFSGSVTSASPGTCDLKLEYNCKAYFRQNDNCVHQVNCL